MKCLSCEADILAKDVSMCPYCGSTNVVQDEDAENLNQKETLKKIEKFERAGRYEDAALLCEKLELWDKAGEIRRKSKTSYVISANLNVGKIGSISMECPHCGASQPITSKSNEVTCSYCKKNYVIPKKILELL
jgi:uncharacterized Zn-finger protein